MTKRKRNFFLTMISASAIFLLFAFIALVPSEPKQAVPQKIVMPYGLTFTLPEDWKVLNKPLVNQFVFKNDQSGENSCYLDVFVVQPDRNYAFSRWLGTAISNQIFLETGKETSYKGKAMFIGNYSFVDDYFKQIVHHQRAILKNVITLVDIHLTYKQNTNCLVQFQEILESVNF